MLPSQWKVCFFLMIELRLAPSMRTVTRLAFIPVAATVFIITAMTSETLGFQLLRMKFPWMTNIAFHFTMFSGKRIFRIMIMVKPCAVPARF